MGCLDKCFTLILSMQKLQEFMLDICICVSCVNFKYFLMSTLKAHRKIQFVSVQTESIL